MAPGSGKPIGAKLSAASPYWGIVEDAYRVFACGKPDKTGVCEGCCMYPEIEADFFQPEIADLPLHYLNDWFFAACDRPLSKPIWQYLLPRILEVLACDQDPASVGREVSLDRFPTGERSNWSAEQWDVLDRFQRRYLRDRILHSQDFLDDTLCMFARGGWPLEALLAQVEEQPDDVLARRFWQDWCLGRPSIWITAFWENGGNSRAFAFYTSRGLYDRMERLALSDRTAPDLAAKALDVAAVIEASADWAQPS